MKLWSQKLDARTLLSLSVLQKHLYNSVFPHQVRDPSLQALEEQIDKYLSQKQTFPARRLATVLEEREIESH